MNKYHDEAGGFVTDFDTPSRGVRVSRMLSLSGGVVSLAMIAGTAMWGYQLVMRDVTGIPVVRALDGPMRIIPEDPGGSRADHQGLAVNEVAAVGSAGRVADQVILAPEPVLLSDEDRAGSEYAGLMAAPEDDGSVTDLAPGEDIFADAQPGADAEADVASSEMDEMAETNAEAGTQGETLLASASDRAVAEALGLLPASTGDAQADALALAEAISAGVPRLSEAETIGAERDRKGISRSPRPLTRPAQLLLAAANAVASPAEASTVDPSQIETVSAPGGIEIDPSILTVGTRLVQLGAFDSDDVARAEWQKISGRFDQYFAGKRRVVQRAKSGGKTFYRLRAEGFADLSDARRFCSALVAEGTDCIPVELR
ncbi:SPOR domain-containing protein [Profundibacterium mesophilum]|uniref:Sporulation related domain containing protein n=1 Tax=Profundibacterium mesophilum KAUST100406-0324 TaxID=1037889 RepID=A0A921TES7_9RHOB|nr:SPOR domain-containing protein [Profundibacterium mesophilum]KAF0677611.1 Sporulation related domain containing protein [Profundibacterium mesophilum KAUST100406-0324]